MKLNNFIMTEAFAAKKETEIIKILSQEFSKHEITNLPLVTETSKSSSYVICYLGDSVYEWDDDGFYTRGRHAQYDPQDDCCCIFYRKNST